MTLSQMLAPPPPRFRRRSSTPAPSPSASPSIPVRRFSSHHALSSALDSLVSGSEDSASEIPGPLKAFEPRATQGDLRRPHSEPATPHLRQAAPSEPHSSGLENRSSFAITPQISDVVAGDNTLESRKLRLKGIAQLAQQFSMTYYTNRKVGEVFNPCRPHGAKYTWRPIEKFF